MQGTKKTIAVVLGDTDMLRPLVLAGIPCAVCVEEGSLPSYSRYALHRIEWWDPWHHPQTLVNSLMDFASTQSSKPVLFYESDEDLLMISRNRDRLSKGFRFVVPDADLTETLVDKQRFQSLAERLELRVPRTRLLSIKDNISFIKDDLNFPIIVKPLTRKMAEWSPIAGLSKAVRIETAGELDKFRRSLQSKEVDYLAQEMIPGAESSIESYHVYVDNNGEIAGEFTGKKIRTYPKEFGQSCALTISDAQDVAETGRQIFSKLNFRGVAKFDFKRDPQGQLYLLEVNPRFNLWHHLGAAAGVNLPDLVYCDLTGLPRPETGAAKAGTNWCRVWQDVISARADGMPLMKWLPWALRCEAKAGLSLDDPLPLFGAALRRTYQKIAPVSFLRRKLGSRSVNSAQKLQRF